MGFLNSLFGFGKNAGDRGQYVTPQAFEKILQQQKAMSKQVVGILWERGVKTSDFRPLEYFFYTDAEHKALGLAAALRELGYNDIDAGQSADDKNLFLVTGWTVPIQIDEVIVVTWTEEMVRLGYKHDVEFDGWGTNP